MNTSLRVPLFHIGTQRQMVFSIIIVTALAAFEMFNFGTTLFAFSDLLGDLSFIGLRWAAILAFAFCAIDFAGIARLFTPAQKTPHNHETWYLFSAWLLAASMNAVLTWWGVSLALLNHETLGNDLIDRGTLLTIVPVFVAILIWLIRVLIIGTFATSGSQMFTADGGQSTRPVVRTYAKPRQAGSDLPVRTMAQSQPNIPHAVVTSNERIGERVGDRNGTNGRFNPVPKNSAGM